MRARIGSLLQFLFGFAHRLPTAAIEFGVELIEFGQFLGCRFPRGDGSAKCATLDHDLVRNWNFFQLPKGASPSRFIASLKFTHRISLNETNGLDFRPTGHRPQV